VGYWILRVIRGIAGLPSVDAATPRTVFQRLGDESDDRWIFTSNRVWIERRDGTVVEERSDPRAALRGMYAKRPGIACT
jgi:hypothetical protein